MTCNTAPNIYCNTVCTVLFAIYLRAILSYLPIEIKSLNTSLSDSFACVVSFTHTRVGPEYLGELTVTVQFNELEPASMEEQF